MMEQKQILRKPNELTGNREQRKVTKIVANIYVGITKNQKF